MLLLDAIQPVGVSTIILDRNNLLPMLGAGSVGNTLLPVQILEFGAFRAWYSGFGGRFRKCSRSGGARAPVLRQRNRKFRGC